MRVHIPRPGPWRRLSVAVGVSLLIHVSLVALGLLFNQFAPRVFVKKGEPLFIELAKPEEEPAPRGNPALPPGPPVRPSPPPAKPTPKIETARPTPKPEPARPAPAKPAPEPAPTQVAKATPPLEDEGTKAAARKEAAKPESSAPPPAAEPRVALSKPHIDLPPSLQGGTGGRPGGGGGLREGRGGIEGEPIPLDTTDPRYTDYFERIRRQIKENWIYPREAGERGIGGQLLIEFAIRKDGWLAFVELKRSSGVTVLDQYALNALKLAQPFPPVPDSVSKGPLPIAGFFTYQIVDSGLLNQYLR